MITTHANRSGLQLHRGLRPSVVCASSNTHCCDACRALDSVHCIFPCACLCLVHLRTKRGTAITPSETDASGDVMHALHKLCTQVNRRQTGFMLVRLKDVDALQRYARIGGVSVLSARLAVHVHHANDHPGLLYTPIGRLCSRQDPSLHSYMATAQVSKATSALQMLLHICKLASPCLQPV